jgi:hypothetical protein
VLAAGALVPATAGAVVGGAEAGAGAVVGATVAAAGDAGA